MTRALPKRLHHKHGAYYHVATVAGKARWLFLSRDYGLALLKWAELEGTSARRPQTVKQLCEEYMRAAKLKPETLRGYGNSLKRLSMFHGWRIERLGTSDIVSYMRRSGKVSANRDRALLGAAYAYARQIGYRGENPAHAIGWRVPEPPRRRYVTDGELARLMACAIPRYARVIRFAYLTGMRQGDICALKLSDASEEGIRYTQGKTGETVLVGWSDELRELWREVAGSRVGRLPAFGYTPDGLRASWARVRRRAGLPDIRFHDLRRKAGSDVDAGHAQALLGHADGKVTAKHYRAKVIAVRPVR